MSRPSESSSSSRPAPVKVPASGGPAVVVPRRHHRRFGGTGFAGAFAFFPFSGGLVGLDPGASLTSGAVQLSPPSSSRSRVFQEVTLDLLVHFQGRKLQQLDRLLQLGVSARCWESLSCSAGFMVLLEWPGLRRKFSPR